MNIKIEKLIQLNENSRNPLNEGYPDYQYQKFQDEYNRRQKMINENINKYYPNMSNEKPEVSSYYQNYVNNPNYNNNTNNKKRLYDERDRDYDKYKDSDKKEYLKNLEEQINYKNDDPDGACKALIKESTEWWSKEDIVCDDITVVVVFF